MERHKRKILSVEYYNQTYLDCAVGLFNLSSKLPEEYRRKMFIINDIPKGDMIDEKDKKMINDFLVDREKQLLRDIKNRYKRQKVI